MKTTACQDKYVPEFVARDGGGVASVKEEVERVRR
jgi:hypothetical protein